MRCAVVVPAFMIQIEFCTRLSGSPIDCAVAPGTAIVMCVRARSLSGPARWYQTEPNAGFTRVPFFSISWSIASDFALSPVASAFMFCATRGRLSMLVHSTENGC